MPTLTVASVHDLAALVRHDFESYRFLTMVEPGPVPEHAPHMGPCLIWVGNTATTGGYPRFRYGGKMVYAHIWSWQTANQRTVPDGHQVDHLCHDPDLCTLTKTCPHRPCVSPAHLDAVPDLVNWARSNNPSARNVRKTHCSHPGCGGSLQPGDPNLYVTPDGRRQCRRCLARRQAEYVARKAVREAERIAAAGQLSIDLSAP